ncbi:MAG: circadian clock protein KaiC [Desulfonauticus sp.]|nr:circadian clock protein KaiC [Desulfonauticus sp.]
MQKLSSGIEGLDKILKGGFIAKRAYLIAGGPGSGKTTLGLHFLEKGSKHKENCLFISLGEKEEQIRENAQNLGLQLKKVDFLDLSPESSYFTQMESYDIFSPAEVEREPTTKAIQERVEKLKPTRVVIDSMTQFRYLAPDVFQFRKQVLSFLRFLAESGATVLFTSEASPDAPDDDLRFLSDGILEILVQDQDRYLLVSKFRGSDFIAGKHSMDIKENQGVLIYPRITLEESYLTPPTFDTLSFGVPEIDELLMGGIERGTVTLLSGPSGVGKTTLGMQFIKETAGRGERSVVYTFEETKEKIIRRCEQVNIAASYMMEKGTLEIKKIEPQIYTPDAFADMLRKDVEKNKTKVVMIDSTSGYSQSIRGKELISELHAVCKYLTQMGVTVLLPSEVKNITGDFTISSFDISYLADNVIFLRYLEIEGAMRKAIGVLKKRLGDFEKTLREFVITRYGIKVGEPLNNLQNILSGTPVFRKEEK